MKTYCLTGIFTVFFVLFSNGILAQTTRSKLDHLELMKQWIGNWKADIGKDTTYTIQCKPFFNGYEFYIKEETRGKLILEEKTLLGYDKKTGKLLESAVNSMSQGISLYSVWFTSPNRSELIYLEDISTPGKAKYKWITEFITPGLMTYTDLVDNKPTGIRTFHRIK